MVVNFPFGRDHRRRGIAGDALQYQWHRLESGCPTHIWAHLLRDVAPPPVVDPKLHVRDRVERVASQTPLGSIGGFQLLWRDRPVRLLLPLVDRWPALSMDAL